MIVYSEEKRGQQSVFIKSVIDTEGNVTSMRKVSIPLYQIEHDGFLYFVLYDDYMKPIPAVYQYLNFRLQESPLTSRSKAAFALRLLYCFLSLSGYKVNNIDEKALRELLFFLRGINTNPEQFSMKTQRSNNTVNGYLSVYRSFFSFAGIHCDAIFKSHTVLSEHVFEGTPSSPERKKYDNNLKAPDYSSDTVPKYIGPDDFKKIFKAIIDAGDKQSRLIVHLMYGYGLRLGEVLGLTTEDIREVRDNGKLVPVLMLRNRMTDAKYQFAKGLPHVIDPRQYTSRDYRAATQRIIITYALYEELIDLIEENHSFLMEKYPENYDAGVADIVSPKDKPETNHYVFLNRYGRVLSDQTWNNTLKKYFEIAGIPVDVDVRDNNLSHRFRHGFAMFHARFSKHPADTLSLQKMMRHKSISSTMVYYNPTPEDEYKIKMEFQKELYDMIPELKEGLNIDIE
jgi:integrase/recombinase XerD